MKARQSLLVAVVGAALALTAGAQARVMHQSGASWSYGKAVESTRSMHVTSQAAQRRANQLKLAQFWRVHGRGGVAPGGRIG
jgi:hypothetical protein